MRNKKIAIDFDGVICDWKDNPIAGVKDAISTLRERGYKIIIHSCNNPKYIEKWLNNNDIRFDSIWIDDGKPVAEYYIDDHGVRFNNNWTEILTEILGEANDEQSDV